MHESIKSAQKGESGQPLPSSIQSQIPFHYYSDIAYPKIHLKAGSLIMTHRQGDLCNLLKDNVMLQA